MILLKYFTGTVVSEHLSDSRKESTQGRKFVIICCRGGYKGIAFMVFVSFNRQRSPRMLFIFSLLRGAGVASEGGIYLNRERRGLLGALIVANLEERTLGARFCSRFFFLGAKGSFALFSKGSPPELHSGRSVRICLLRSPTPLSTPVRNEKSAQRASSGAGYPVDVHGQNSGVRSFG